MAHIEHSGASNRAHPSKSTRALPGIGCPLLQIGSTPQTPAVASNRVVTLGNGSGPGDSDAMLRFNTYFEMGLKKLRITTDDCLEHKCRRSWRAWRVVPRWWINTGARSAF
jgi:hypothetical protein